MNLLRARNRMGSGREAPHTHNFMTMQLMRRWLVEEDGQDLIEYALLASFVGFTMAGGVAWLRTAMQTTYTSWDTGYQTDALVEVPDPK